MLFGYLKNIEILMEGNEYSTGGVTYYIGIDKIDSSLPLDLAVKKHLIEMEAVGSSEINLIMTLIKEPENELKQLCMEWHIDEGICNKILDMIDENVKMYRCCDDYEYISRGCVGELFRIIEKGEERVLIDFYVAD